MKSKKIISVFLMMLTLFTMFTLSASALSWDGSSAGGSTNAVNGSSKGYVIRDTNDSNCVVGYRFSVVNSSGGMKVTKVMDVYRNTTNGNHAYSTSAKFSTKYNKKQMIANKNAKLTTTSNTTNCYKESDMSFLTALPNPSGIETWQAYETNINKVLTKIGVGTTANMIYGDKVIIEPLFDICLAGEYQALTVSEIAYCGRSVKGGSSDGGTSNGTSSTWGFIANYTNRIWPNKLYTPNGQGLWTAASKIADGTKETFDNILTKGYGAGIAYNETANITYTIKFDGNGSTSGSTASMSMVKDVAKNLTANGFKKTGNKFVSWNTKADGSGTKYTDKQSVKNLSSKQGATVTLYAQWSPYTLTVAYNCTGSSVTVSDTSKGFSLGTSNRITTTTENNKTIDGTKNVYYQSFKYNSELGGKGLHNFGSFGLSAPTGYRFVGWKCGSTTFDDDVTTYKPTNFTSDIKTGDATVWLTASFSPNTYSVKFNGNGSTSGTMSNESFTYDTAKALTANAFKREFTVTYNYNGNGSSNTTAKATATFGGWAKSATGSKAYDNSQSVKNLSSTNGATVNLYAKWTDGSVTLPTPTRTGYSFSGWYTATSGGTKIGNGGAKYTPSANITLYARWAPNTYTVKYYFDGVEQTSLNQSCTYGTSYKYAALPTKTGYKVSGWWSGSTADNMGTQYTAGGNFSNLTATNNGTVKRYAYSNSKSYTVKYYLDGTEQTNLSQTCLYDASYKYPSLPSKTGYSITGWWSGSTSASKGTQYSAGSSFSNLTSTSNGTVKRYCYSTPITYSVKFNGNGSTSGSMSNQSFTYDVAKNLTANAFKREFTVTYNYNGNGKDNTTAKATATFTGWAKSSTGTKAYDNSQNVKNLSSTNGATVNLYAKWTDSSVTLPTPTRTGYSFSGWYTATSGGTKIGNGGAKYTPSANITLYARWAPNTYTVKYYFDGVEQTSLNQSCTYGTSYKYAALPTKTGYKVSGWWSGSTADNMGTQYTAGGSFSNLTATNNATVKRYAYSNSKSYTVKYYLDGTEQTNLSQTCLYDASYKYPSLPSKTGYSITGWWSGSTSASKGTQYSAGSSFSNLTSTSNGTVKRYCYSTPITYSVKFNGNGSTSGSMSNESFTYDVAKALTANAFKREFTVTYDYNDTATAKTTAKATATFTGWSKTSTGEKAYDDKQSVKNLTSKDGDIVNIYAMWTDGSVTLPTPTRTGYTFSGWYTAVSGGTKIGNGGAKYTPSANITLYGHWTPITYTIKFDKNGATGGSTASMAMTYDVSKKLTANGFTWENHKWLKWNTKADGTGTSYTDEQSVKNLSSKQDATITLYAQWEKIEENLSLYLEPIMPNAAYRENTDVVTGFRIVNNSKTDITPNKNVSVVFTVKNGDTAIRRVTVSDVVVPAENKNILYFKWTVPVNISASSVKISGKIFINGVADYVTTNNYTTCKYTISETPDTQFEVSAPDGFTKPSVPATSTNTATWNEWKYENGEFKEVKYGISISTDTLEITPAASANPTKKDGVWVMKSGYGIELTVANNVKQVSGYTMPGSDAYTKPQYASATFPEFGYGISDGKCRTLEQISNKWTFRENGSYGHIHFTPLWYPDGNYCVSVIQRDCWTPTGMISRTVNSNNVTISGSAYDDWTIN